METKKDTLNLRITKEDKKELKKRAIDLELTVTEYLLRLFAEEVKNNTLKVIK